MPTPEGSTLPYHFLKCNLKFCTISSKNKNFSVKHQWLETPDNLP
jgi:hypothetical protein